MKTLTLKDLAIAFANNQKVSYFDDERELNQICRIFKLTEDSVSITNGEYQYDDLSFDKVDIKENSIVTIKKLQETLKEVAERLYPNGCDGTDRSAVIYRRIFIDVAKWQEQKTIEEIFEWLTTKNYLTDLKETMIIDFKNFKNK